MKNSEQYVFARIMPNTIKGCFYGFIPTQDIIEDLAELESNNNITIQATTSSNQKQYSIIEVNPPYLINAINAENRDTFVKGDVEIIKKEMADAVVEFEKFLVQKGKTTEGFKATIAIYSTNKTPSLMYNSRNYPAFRLNLLKTLQILDNMGYTIQIKQSFVPISVAVANLADLWQSLKLSPIKNGVFLNIRCGLSAEQMKQKEIELKQKYS